VKAATKKIVSAASAIGTPVCAMLGSVQDASLLSKMSVNAFIGASDQTLLRAATKSELRTHSKDASRTTEAPDLAYDKYDRRATLAGPVTSKPATDLITEPQVAPFYDTAIGRRFINPLLKPHYRVVSMPETAKNIADDFNISRDDQGAFALRSRLKDGAAISYSRLAKVCLGEAKASLSHWKVCKKWGAICVFARHNLAHISADSRP
jgi:hypothetical protein